VTTLALSIGSNIDAESNIRAAVNALKVEFENIRCSTIYESKAVGFDGDNFLNFVVLADTEKALTDVAAFLKRLEDRRRCLFETSRGQPGTRSSAGQILWPYYGYRYSALWGGVRCFLWHRIAAPRDHRECLCTATTSGVVARSGAF